ncbi:kinesin-like protein KIF24 [Alligator mississippiensis]|uniref:Kinesin-like protein KIF24 n=1 Tax=Alligator mississippiensis TaxID=8496 RepID=A0A151M1S1_ALLMI|nr:kinesin-like protein KIF24 [Alligator mississippiensis]
MSSWLYECLCEAELEKYYPHFAALGLQKIDELAKVSMKDYAKLGVHNMNDRKRLFQLIRIIQIMQEEEETADTAKEDFQTSGLLQPQVTRSGPRRQLRFESLFEKKDGTVKDCETGSYGLSDFSASEDGLAEMLGHVPRADLGYNKAARRETLTASGACTEHDMDYPTMYSSNNIAPLLGSSEAPIIQRVTHISGYNYGLPHSCIRSNTSEKETPWTETDKIHVCVRKRPLGPREERRGEVNIITVKDKETLLLHEKKEAVDLTQYILQHVFYFDEVFGEACTNQDVYMKTAHPLIQHVFNGGNATCFAYGQTGAGKTYTMIGTHQNPGLYALAAKDIFRQLEASQPRRDLLVWISFYEIYCGQLYDLLHGRKRLFAREDSKHVVQIVGLREVQVDTVDLLLEVILKGGKERSTGATGVNSDSSRSHAIIQIQVKDAAKRTFGRISFIDLAGSERAADARDSDRQTKMEGAEINQSLLALKECIRALDQEHAHTPFRQSKLTQVLKDSFIGNSKTCMIASVSPSHIATEHTLNTLRYADRVKELKKGMKCCTPVASRRRPAGNPSPKRIQNSPSVQGGEKSSPKKVKLGLQHPLTSVRAKACASVFHAAGIPFSSTPKGANKSHTHKANASSPWLHHPSPVKGMLPTGHLTKKKMDLTPLSEKNHFVKDFVVKTAGTPEAKERSQGDTGTQDKQPVRCLKVQTVQPVQKQLISREDFSLGDVNHPSDSSQSPGNTFLKQCLETWTDLSPYQKGREEHLRLYHQQFQQPPILQQKLNYQPLERFLAQYKPQEIRVKPEQSLTPRDAQCKDGMQLEELDDSDFSEDSFSPVCTQETAKKKNPSDCSQLSFFLHQREQGVEEEQKVCRKPGLFFNHATHMEEHELDDSWDYSKGSSFPKTKESIKDAEKRTQSDWSIEGDVTIDSSLSDQTAEKPYCLHEDLVWSWKDDTDSSADHGQYSSKQKSQVSPGESSLFPDKDTQCPCVPYLLDSGPLGCKEIDLHPAQREDSIKGRLAPVGGNVEGKNLINAASNTSSEFTSELMAPLTLSLLDDEEAADPENHLPAQEGAVHVKQMLETKICSPRKELEGEARGFLRDETSPVGSVPELGEQMYHHETKYAGHHTPHTENMWLSQACPEPQPCCGLEDSGLLNACHGSVNALFPGDADLTEDSGSGARDPCEEKEGLFFLSHLKCGEYVNSRHYEADTEDAPSSLLNCPGKPSLGKATGLSPMSQIVCVDTPAKGCFASPPPIPNEESEEGTVYSPPQETSPLQPSSEFRPKDFSRAEDMFKLSFSGEELGLLQNKLVQSLFPQSSFDAAEVTKEIKSLANPNSPPSTSILRDPTDTSETSDLPMEVLGEAQQAVIRAHREQLDEMAALRLQEECLLRQVAAADFENFVSNLDEILILKSKCIQSMRAQLQLYLACPRANSVLQRATSS